MESNHLEHLAGRVSDGDPAAEQEFRQALEPSLARIVRHALRAGAVTPLGRHILERASRLLREAGDDSEWIVGHVTHSLCESVIRRLRAGPPRGQGVHETVRMAVGASW